MKRTTTAQLDSMVARINELTGSPLEAYTKQTDGTFKANVGNYHLSGAYSGVSLHRMHNSSGGVVDVFSCGHVPKRELAARMMAFIEGIYQAKGLDQ